MRIIFDFDGVVCHSQEEMMCRLSKRVGKKISINDWKVYDYKENFPEYITEMKQIFTENVYDGYECRIDSDIVNIIKYAKREGNDVSIHTFCANENVFRYKTAMLIRNGITKHEVGDVVPLYTFDKDEVDCDIIVEDCAENLIKSKARYKVLVDKPWNEGIKCRDIIRCRDGKEVYRVVLNIIEEYNNGKRSTIA